MAVANGAQINSWDAKRALVVERNSGAVIGTISVEVDTQRGEELVDIVGEQAQDAADQTWGRSSSSTAGQDGSGDDSSSAHVE